MIDGLRSSQLSFDEEGIELFADPPLQCKITEDVKIEIGEDDIKTIHKKGYSLFCETPKLIKGRIVI